MQYNMVVAACIDAVIFACVYIMCVYKLCRIYICTYMYVRMWLFIVVYTYMHTNTHFFAEHALGLAGAVIRCTRNKSDCDRGLSKGGDQEDLVVRESVCRRERGG